MKALFTHVDMTLIDDLVCQKEHVRGCIFLCVSLCALLHAFGDVGGGGEDKPHENCRCMNTRLALSPERFHIALVFELLVYIH